MRESMCTDKESKREVAMYFGVVQTVHAQGRSVRKYFRLLGSWAVV